MAIKFIDAVRVNPAPCGHFELTIEVDDATERTHRLTFDELDKMIDEMSSVIGEGPRAWEIAMCLFWIRYQIEHGKTIPQMRGEIVVEPLL